MDWNQRALMSTQYECNTVYYSNAFQLNLHVVLRYTGFIHEVEIQQLIPEVSGKSHYSRYTNNHIAITLYMYRPRPSYRTISPAHKY